MPISFEAIPQNWRQPLYFVEVDPSKAGLPLIRQPALLVGVMLSAGIASADVPIPIGTQAEADKQFGRGSQLAAMFKTFYANNWGQEVWGVPLAEPGAGTAATGTITIGTAPTEAGTLHLYIAGVHVPIGVTSADTPTTVAAAIVTAITADTNLPVTATSALGVVTVLCKWKGTSGNDIDMRDNYYGTVGGQEMPVSMTVTYSGSGKLTTGAGVPVFTTAISNLGENEYEYVALPFTDSTSLLAWETEYGFSDSGRWGWMRQLYGHLFSAMRGAYATLIAFGPTRNSAQLSVLGVELGSPSPIWDWAAAYTAKSARGLTNDPARPLQTLQLANVLPARGEDRFVLPELNALSGYGIATQRTLVANTAIISRETTTAQLNRYGFTDDAYELVTTLATLARLMRNQRQAITSKFPRHKLANDGTRFGAGQAIVTPKIVKAELVAQYRQDEFDGLVEDVASFKAHLIVERDSAYPTRLNVLYPPDLINGLRMFAVLAQFRLQYNRGFDQEIV